MAKNKLFHMIIIPKTNAKPTVGQHEPPTEARYNTLYLIWK
jgi:hypothetical protein